ncbi:hemolysins and related proteins containing CBS domains [Photobacterium aphoticum]|uniref:Hemolysins and related proteins containing CBS domains n=1 Tax=Photobacterium aphoticum TaxID=754436 RepID=A0A090RMK1_9GAMM|nr:hemolysins and related proteins containing CBS domains [Photobacterium aphoticum]
MVNEAGGLIPRRHQDMLLSILDLENVTVEDLMVPRNEIAAINVNDDWKSIVRQLSHSATAALCSTAITLMKWWACCGCAKPTA